MDLWTVLVLLGLILSLSLVLVTGIVLARTAERPRDDSGSPDAASLRSRAPFPEPR